MSEEAKASPAAPCVMMVAVEPSADALGAALASALRRRLGANMGLVGVGGPLMAEQGLSRVFDPARLAVVGVFNALGAYPEVLRRAGELATFAARARPDIVILIDAWGFNLRVARGLRRTIPGTPIVKYVAPQVWATRPGRARTLAGAVDHLLTIHSFDSHYFVREGLRTVFVGNPALNRDLSSADGYRLRRLIGIGADEPVVLLLPGSRAGEVRRLLPHFGDAVHRLAEDRDDLRFVLPAADSVVEQIRAGVVKWRRAPIIVEGERARLDAMKAATAALACSGTVTTELALAGCPMVVAYRLDRWTHAVAKRLIRTEFITLFNVAAGRFVAPERVQARCTGKILAADLARLLDNPSERVAQIEAQTAALGLMRGGISEPIDEAAAAIHRILEQSSVNRRRPVATH